MTKERDILIRYRLERARETLAEADVLAQTGQVVAHVGEAYR